MDKKTIFVVISNTESGDLYTWAFKTKPSIKLIKELTWKREGQNEDLSFYLDTGSVEIHEVELKD